MVYVAGSLLFALALLVALVVIAAQFAAYWRPMIAALRTVRLDSIHAPAPRRSATARGAVLSYRPARQSRPVRALAA